MVVWTSAQESAPAQPLAEAQVAQEFKKAAPDLFREWVKRRPEVLKSAALGERASGPAGCNTGWFEFIECQDISPPTEYKIDVTRTESILTPFLGLLVVPVHEKCNVRNVVPGAMSRSEKSLAMLDPHCLGKSYEECTTAGGKPISKMSPGGCMGSSSFSFTHNGEDRISYRWSDGRWEFDSEKGDKPVPPTGSAH
jgi:hypothetical protein